VFRDGGDKDEIRLVEFVGNKLRQLFGRRIIFGLSAMVLASAAPTLPS